MKSVHHCRLWIVVAAFFVSKCNVFDINPLAVAFFVAVCLRNEMVLFTYGVILLGLVTSFSVDVVARYGLAMAVVAAVLMNRKSITLRRESLLASFLAGGITAIVDGLCNGIVPQVFPQFEGNGKLLATMLDTSLEPSVVMIVFEGLVVFSSAYIFQLAIKVVTEDFARIATDSESAIVCMLLAGTVLYGMPEKTLFGIVVAESFALFSIVLSTYMFGFGLGTAWAVFVGLIRAGIVGELSYMICYVVLAMVCAAMQNLLKCGRFMMALVFAFVYMVCGNFEYTFLLSWDGKKALATALFLFLLLPKSIVLQVESALYRGSAKKSSNVWGEFVLRRVQNFAAAMKRIDYTFAGNVAVGASFADVGAMLEDFTDGVSKEVPLKKTLESKIVEELAKKNLRVCDMSLAKNREGKFKVYLTLRTRKYKLVTTESVRKIVERELGIRLMTSEDSRQIIGAENTLICLQEKPAFVCRYAVRKLSRYPKEISGDNYYVGEIADGKMLIMIADGMGNGTQASLDSSTLLEAMEELLSAGFEQETAIRIVNAYMSELNKGERFATLDLLLLDLYTGYGSIYKQGAATTYIKRGNWMELVKSTSLPVGVVDGAVCEQCTKKFYHQDMIVLVSDGVLESIIFENKEDYLRDLLLKTDENDPEELVSYIVKEIHGMCGNRLQDDATIVACKLVKSL